jgi:hypothetical protein
MTERKKKRAGVSQATALRTQRRVDELLRIRLDGAEFWDVREYVREKENEEGSPWELAEGASPLSDSQIWRLIAKADDAIQASHSRSRRRLVRHHLAQRRNLYAKALLAGDVRTALACKRDEAELLGLYPAKRAEVTGKGGGAIQTSNTHEHKQPAPPSAAVLALLEHLGVPTAELDRALRADGDPQPPDTPRPDAQAGAVPPAR